jgi:serine/threonine protein kinase
MSIERQQQQQQNRHEVEGVVPREPDSFPESSMEYCTPRDTCCFDSIPAAFTSTSIESNVIHTSNSNIAYLPGQILSSTCTGGIIVKCQKLLRYQNAPHDELVVMKDVPDTFYKTGVEVAVKVFSIDNIKILKSRNHAEDAVKEINAMKFIGNNHKCLMGCEKVLSDEKSIYVVMKLCTGGDLHDSVVRQIGENQNNNFGPGLTETQIRTVFRKIVASVHTLHSVFHICHRYVNRTTVLFANLFCY